MSEWRADSISCFLNYNGRISAEGVFIRRKTCAGGVIKFPSFSLISLSTRPAGPHRKWHYFPDAATGAPERRTPDTPRYHSGPLQPAPPQKLLFENCSYFLGSVLHFFVFESSFKFDNKLLTVPQVLAHRNKIWKYVIFECIIMNFQVLLL